MDIAGKVFVVTGGGNGIGREVVLGLLARGARVAAVDLSTDGLAETAALGGTAGERLEHAHRRHQRPHRRGGAARAVIAAHGQVDGLLNVAGIIQRVRPLRRPRAPARSRRSWR